MYEGRKEGYSGSLYASNVSGIFQCTLGVLCVVLRDLDVYNEQDLAIASEIA